MAIKRKEVLSRDDFRDAVNSQQISISQIAKATGVPRTYLSEFLNIGRPIKSDQLQKIRDYLESEGVEFEDAPAADSRAGSALPPSLAVANICHFPIRPDRVEEAKAVLGEIDRNDLRIAELLDKRAKKKVVLLGGDSDEYTSGTQDALRELFALFGANYLLFRYLTLEKNPLDQGNDKTSLRSAVVGILKESFEKAGVTTAPAEPVAEPPSDADAAAEPEVA